MVRGSFSQGLQSHLLGEKWQKRPYRSAYLFPYFFNMLSEGANRQ